MFYLENRVDVQKRLFELLSLEIINFPLVDQFQSLGSLSRGYYRNEYTVRNVEKYQALLKWKTKLNVLSNTHSWPRSAVEEIIEGNAKYGLGIRYVEKPLQDKDAITFTEARPSFYEFYIRGVTRARSQLGLFPFPDQIQPIIDKLACFEDLGASEKTDKAYSLSESFWVDRNNLLLPHATSAITLKGYENVLDICRVYRRENTDKTHNCEFLQMQYRKLYDYEEGGSKPFKKLKEDLLCIYKCFGVDVSKLVFRRTRYRYVTPGLQVFYKGPTEMVQIAGAGIITPECTKNLSWDGLDYPNRYVLAAGFGIQRLYTCCYGLTALRQTYDNTQYKCGKTLNE